MRRVVFVLASAGVASVLALGAVFIDSNVGIAQPRKCPPGTTYEKPIAGHPGVCTYTWVGTSRSDEIDGWDDPRITDKIYGKGGSDVLYGYRGSDGISGGSGHDTLWGDGGNDALYGDAGIDTIYGGPGHDEVWDMTAGAASRGGGGRDIIWLGPGDDYIVAEDGERDMIWCGPGEDDISVDRIDVAKDCEPDDFAEANYWWAILMDYS